MFSRGSAAQRARTTPAWCKFASTRALRIHTTRERGTTVKTATQQDIHSLESIGANRSRVLGCCAKKVPSTTRSSVEETADNCSCSDTMVHASGLSSFLEAGNTQPGGFCRGFMDSMKRPDTPRDSSTSPRPRFGMATQLSNEQRRGDVVTRTGERHVGFSSIVAPWQISDSMMHVPWGTVLRSLDPGSTNIPERRAPTPYVGSMGSARANPYSSAKSGHHMPGTHMRYSALSARHGTLPEASVVM